MSENAKIDFKKLLLAANIKQEPGVTPPRHNRLPSFKGVRDLNLNSATALAPKPSLDAKSRKVFTPNLNVQRNKHKVDGVAGGLQLQGRRPQQQQNRGGHDGGRGRGRGRGRAVLVQSSGGVFSEGVSAESIAARRERSSYGKSDSAAAEYIPKPKLNLNHKIDKQEEEQKLNQLLKDDFLNDPTLEPDSSNAPVTLPNLCLAKVKAEVKKEEPKDPEEVLPGGIKIKKEKVDPDEKPLEKCPDVKPAHWLEDTKAKFVLLQLPDTLPGPRAEEAAKPSTAAQDPAPESGEQKCVLRQLPEGQVGKLQVMKSGNVRLVLGKMVLNVFPGTEVSYKQVAMSVDLQDNSRGGDMINLGPIVDRLVCTPDWETLLSKCTI